MLYMVILIFRKAFTQCGFKVSDRIIIEGQNHLYQIITLLISVTVMGEGTPTN